jgi:dTDP-4-dehydrorhamnose reductase
MHTDEASILILGSSGQVGTALTRQQWPHNVWLETPPHELLDITNEAAVAAVVGSRKWSCVINCAAYTAVDAAESDAENAWRINAVGPALLAAAAARTATPILHLSTDYVFDGMANHAYRPSDPIRPLSVYGQSKAAGEEGIRKANSRHLVLRTSWVMSPFGKNFVKTMLRLAARGESLRVVDDQFGRPTSAGDLAAAIRLIALQLIGGPARLAGTYHFANTGRATWYNLARAIMSGASRRGSPSVPIEPVATADFPTRAHRPVNSELCTADITRDFALEPRPWQVALDEILDALLVPGCEAPFQADGSATGSPV